MLSKKLLSFGVALLLSLSGVLIAMTQMSRASDKRRPDSLAIQSNVMGKGILSQKSGEAGPQSIEEAQLNYQRLQRDLAYLDAYLRNNDLDGFVKAADELERNWSQEGGEYYGRLMLNISNLIANGFQHGFRDEKIYPLSQKYIFAALAQADSFSLELESKLLPFIARDLAPIAATGDVNSEWIKERSVKAKLWLHAWQRLEKGIDRNFNFSDVASLNVCPPEETNMPCGISPEGIKDSKLRAQYQAAITANTEKSREYNRQFVLRQISEHFPQKAEKYLIDAYSKQPYNVEELKKYLDEYLRDEGLKVRILNEVKKR
jgi:hypothetical protein